jgi:hypothetical protein
MLIAAGLIATAYGACHLLGLREDVSVLFATSRSGSAAQSLGGVAYVFLYLAAILACPILVLASGILALLELHREGE